jgi:RNA polymerase sigma-70 factor (ECF subfamily)
VKVDFRTHRSKAPLSQDPHENELLERLRLRDPEALTSLYRLYGQRLFSLSFRLLADRGAAEEVVQDVFCKLWQHPEMFRPESGILIAWLYTVARNLALDRKRKENRRPVEDVFNDMTASSAAMTQPDLLALADPFLARNMRGAIESLPPEQKTVVELAYFEGMTHAEIAEALNEALGTVKTRLRLGLNKLRAAMKSEGQVNQ